MVELCKPHFAQAQDAKLSLTSWEKIIENESLIVKQYLIISQENDLKTRENLMGNAERSDGKRKIIAYTLLTRTAHSMLYFDMNDY